jgi:hypothetical protein
MFNDFYFYYEKQTNKERQRDTRLRDYNETMRRCLTEKTLSLTEETKYDEE